MTDRWSPLTRAAAASTLAVAFTGIGDAIRVVETPDADVQHLADVIADAHLRGIRNGPYTLARTILDAGYQRAAVTEVESDEPVRVIVLGGCGHWWRESRPASVKIRPDQPRVCTGCKPDHPAAVGTSPQGMAMVRVTYLPDPGREALP